MPSDFSKKTNGISDSGSPKSHVYESNLITRAGHAVTTASTVSQARQAIIEETFDLLLSDLGLPDGSGWEVVEALREKSAIPRQAAGFTEHLVKPVAAELLRELLVRSAAPN